MSGASIIYTEPETGTETKQMSDYEGILSSTPYEFTVTGSATGTTILNYAIYLEELEGNTVDKSNIRYYLSDENNIPVYMSKNTTTPYPYDDSNVIITPENNEKLYNSYVDVVIKDSTGNEVTNQVKNVNEYNYLLLYYAKNVLNLSDGGSFNIEAESEEGNACYNVSYEELTDDVVLSALDSSDCTLFYGPSSEEGYSLTDKSSNKVLYTATFSNKYYLEFDDGVKYEGDIISYIAEKENVQANNSFYIKSSYTAYNELNNALEEVGSYCNKYTLDEEGYYDSELTENSNCANAYTIVEGSVAASTLGDLDNSVQDEYSSLSNVIETDSIEFLNGTAILNGKGNGYIEQRYKNPTRTYKLRYWISDNASDSTGTTATETTPTTDGKTHTVEFGGTGVFQFKVNVYAYQGTVVEEETP